MALPELAYRLIGRFSVSRFDRVLHPILYRRFGGRGVLGRPLGTETILLTTTGRRSGESRTVALFGFLIDGAWTVVASRGGSRRLPAWYRNLVDHPRAHVRYRDLHIDVVARDLEGGAYEAAFEVAATAYPGYRLYRRESPFPIPIVRLQPVDAAKAAA